MVKLQFQKVYEYREKVDYEAINISYCIHLHFAEIFTAISHNKLCIRNRNCFRSTLHFWVCKGLNRNWKGIPKTKETYSYSYRNVDNTIFFVWALQSNIIHSRRYYCDLSSQIWRILLSLFPFPEVVILEHS